MLWLHKTTHLLQGFAPVGGQGEVCFSCTIKDLSDKHLNLGLLLLLVRLASVAERSCALCNLRSSSSGPECPGATCLSLQLSFAFTIYFVNSWPPSQKIIRSCSTPQESWCDASVMHPQRLALGPLGKTCCMVSTNPKVWNCTPILVRELEMRGPMQLKPFTRYKKVSMFVLRTWGYQSINGVIIIKSLESCHGL